MVASGRVRSFKQIFCAVFGTRRLTDEGVDTSFYVVEYQLNARPLTPESAHPSNLGAITPNLFLFGNQTTPIPTLIGFNEFDHGKRYARAQF